MYGLAHPGGVRSRNSSFRGIQAPSRYQDRSKTKTLQNIQIFKSLIVKECRRPDSNRHAIADNRF